MWIWYAVDTVTMDLHDDVCDCYMVPDYVYRHRASRPGMGGAVQLSRERWSCAGVRVVGVEGGGCRGRRGRGPVQGPGGTTWGPHPLWQVAHPVSGHCCLRSACVYSILFSGQMKSTILLWFVLWADCTHQQLGCEVCLMTWYNCHHDRCVQ